MRPRHIEAVPVDRALFGGPQGPFADDSWERLEMEKLELEKQLLQARTEDLKAAKKTEELYQQAIQAMKDYGGH